MCIIIYTPNGHIPKKHLATSLAHNKDGWGLMWAEKGKLQIMKGMTVDEFRLQWGWVRRLGLPLVFHARIATHGTTDLDNCHPFMIPNHDQLALAHNGIISQQSYKNKENMSDTRLFIENILSNLPKNFYRSRAMRTLIADYIGHSKLAIMNGKGEVTIINSNQGEWIDERWYSNDSYRPWGYGACRVVYHGCGDGKYQYNHKPVGCEDKTGTVSKSAAFKRNEHGVWVPNVTPDAPVQDANTLAAYRTYYKQEEKRAAEGTAHGVNDKEDTLGTQADELQDDTLAYSALEKELEEEQASLDAEDAALEAEVEAAMAAEKDALYANTEFSDVPPDDDDDEDDWDDVEQPQLFEDNAVARDLNRKCLAVQVAKGIDQRPILEVAADLSRHVI